MANPFKSNCNHRPDPRIAELTMFAALEHIKLPMTPEQILIHEDAGNVVDLRTGQVMPAQVGTPTGLGTVMAYRLRKRGEL
jgi:hypothetical protein